MTYLTSNLVRLSNYFYSDYRTRHANAVARHARSEAFDSRRVPACLSLSTRHTLQVSGGLEILT